jgi:outer membrane protein assembly factor BamA
LSHLTDSLIDEAVHELPKEMFEKEGENLMKLMRSRRDKFSSAIEEYYWNTSCYVDVWASDKPEFAEVTRLNDDSVNIALFKRDKETGGKKGEPFFERTFDKCYTKEIRVYLQGGDDYAKVSGNVNGSIQVRIIGGEGKDELVDSSNVRGFLWSILPFKTNKKRTLFYESGDKTEFVYGSSTEVDDTKFERPPEDSLPYEPLYRDWGHEWKGFPWLGYNTDDGLFLGAIAKLTSYSFRSIPYQNQMDFRFGYAIKAERFRGVYDALFPNVWHGTLGLFARASGLEVLNYFGLGNETTYDNEKVDAGYYKIRQQQYIFAPSYEYQLINHFSVKGFGSLRYFKTPLDELPDSSILKSTKPYGTDNALVTTWGASGTYDSRNNQNFPEKGIYATVSSAWTPEVMDNKYAYTRAVGDVRAYITAPVLAGITLAVRARAEKIWGEHPFYDAAFLGGPNDLRGFTRERFAGDASLLGGAELRVNLGKFFILVPGDYGFTVSAESGKVSVRKQPESDKWHASIDWGLWITPIDKDNVISVTVASSAERTSVILGGSFGF